MTMPTPAQPIYLRVAEEKLDNGTQFWSILCDEGWRQSIVASGMYDWAADWLLGVIGNRPFAAEVRP